MTRNRFSSRAISLKLLPCILAQRIGLGTPFFECAHMDVHERSTRSNDSRAARFLVQTTDYGTRRAAAFYLALALASLLHT